MSEYDTGKYPSAAEIRAWGMKINPGAVDRRGTLPIALIRAWDKAHPGRPYVKREAHHGTLAGYNLHDCHCDRCLEVKRRYEREQYRSKAEDKWMGIDQ